MSTEDLGDPFLLMYAYRRSWRPIRADFMPTEDLGESMATHSCSLAEVVHQPLPGLPLVTPGYSMGLISVCQPEPGLRRVTMLALATRLLGNSQ